jgi:predicted kinase
MNKPLLVVVTGKPASGKSTLAHILSKELKCPLISRDELKEGYINTIGIEHSNTDNSTGLHIYNTFFEIINLLISKGISIIIEAAFQDKLWKPKLPDLSNKANIKIIICNTPTAKNRFIDRLQSDPSRDKFHGDNSLKERGGLLTDTYEPVHMNAPTLEVDTTENYNPDISEIIRFIKQKTSH